MIDMLQGGIKMSLREKFNEYFNHINRAGKESLLQYLEDNHYFTSPSSTKFHGAYEEGNLQHSINVTETMLNIATTLSYNFKKESILIVGLFHDLAKASYYGYEGYIPNLSEKTNKQSESKPFKVNPNMPPIPHEVASLHILSKFIQLTDEEATAIVFHNGLYTGLGREINGKETPLMLLLHFSDMWDSRVTNPGIELKEERLF